ncbi:MAG: DEAD/DEAH box helicase [Candidatus Micrarchaeia archaeon]
MLEPEVVELIRSRGFEKFTEIQKKAVPLAAEGRNLLVIAPTGHGKTEAAFFPVLSKLVAQKKLGNTAGIQALYITPLKSLNRDMLSRLSAWCSELGVSLGVRHGDTPASQRAKQRDNPPMLVITTPETLASMLVAPKLRDALSLVRSVIVDEVHELVESKRGLQLALSLERLRERCGGFQVIGLSATVGSEGEAARFLSGDAVVVKDERARELHLSVEFPAESEGEVASAKVQRIKQLILSHKKTLVFVNTRSFAESLGSLLMRCPDLKDLVAVHHSSLSKEARIETEEKFKAGNLKAIICTSSLELGIDVGDVDLVVQYVSPRQVSRFLQRVGRSGHRTHLVPVGELVAVDFMDCVECCVIAKRAREGLLEPLSLRANALDVLAHFIAGCALDKPGVSVEEVFSLARKAWAFSSLSRSNFDRVLSQLSLQRTISLRDGRIFKSLRTLLYYYENLSMIPDEKRFFVFDAGARKNVGILHEEFVADLREGSVFIARGRPWRVLSVSEDRVVVEPSEDLAAAIPEWEGEQIPVPGEVAREAGELIYLLLNTSNAELKRSFCASEEAADRMRRFAYKQKQFFLPSARIMVAEEFERFIVLHSFAGTKANDSLARILSALLTSQLGAPVRARPSAYAILFEFSKKFSAEKFLAVLEGVSPEAASRVLLASLANSSMLRFRFVHVAKRFGLLRKNFDARAVSLKRLFELHKNSPVMEEAVAEVLHEKLALSDLKQILSDIQGRRIHLQVWDADARGLSPLGREFMEFGGFAELFAPPEPTAQLVQIFKDNLLEKTVSLVCTNCAKQFSVRLASLNEKPLCPYCGSDQLSLERYGGAVVARARERRKLNAREKACLREALRVASLVSAYGRKALLALETYGVGPEGAARVLKKMRRSEEDFYRDLLESQKTFVRTRRYWRA